jgi:hypothetical protein
VGRFNETWGGKLSASYSSLLVRYLACSWHYWKYYIFCCAWTAFEHNPLSFVVARSLAWFLLSCSAQRLRRGFVFSRVVRPFDATAGERVWAPAGVSSGLCKRPDFSLAPQAIGAFGKWEYWVWIPRRSERQVRSTKTLVLNPNAWVGAAARYAGTGMHDSQT